MDPALNRVGLVTRADGREVRRLVTYLPPDVMSRLRICCVERGVSLSDVTAQAIRVFLEMDTKDGE